MIEVDGSAGGGQLLRTAIGLSMVTGEPVAVGNVRGNRSDRGLKHQHLTALETAAAICAADVEGAELGSESVTFRPGPPVGGTYEADVGTAGSLTLVFDTVLPVATRLDERLTLTARGGTDVKWAPPMAYQCRVKLPLLRRFGLAATVDPGRTGFYPAGGGEATLHLWPSSLDPIELPGGTPVRGARIYSVASDGLAEAEVAERQAETASGRLADLGVETSERHVSYVDSPSPGSVIVVRIDRAGCFAGFDAFGEPGKPAEEVATESVDGVRAFVRGEAAVDAHLADQLLVWLALASGEVEIPRLTDHVESSLALLETFGFDLDVFEGDETVLVSGSGR